TQNLQTARLALFGICREDSSILATCERGASLASISADVSGRNNSYNAGIFIPRGVSGSYQIASNDWWCGFDFDGAGSASYQAGTNVGLTVVPVYNGNT
ncbi:MAG: hypothetical protein II458_05080, partial [Oscillospiraceae bacterium]|nr:hypothetical protein [Oscillospiraceae bacterium]